MSIVIIFQTISSYLANIVQSRSNLTYKLQKIAVITEEFLHL